MVNKSYHLKRLNNLLKTIIFTIKIIIVGNVDHVI